MILHLIKRTGQLGMPNHFTIYNSMNDCIVRIVTEKPTASEMRLILGGKPDHIVMSAGLMYFRSDDWGLPENHAANAILEVEGDESRIHGNVIIIARNGLQSAL